MRSTISRQKTIIGNAVLGILILFSVTVGDAQYRSVAYAADSIAELPLNEGSGVTASDLSGNANHGAVLNGAVWVPGKIGNALSFDGVNDHVRIPSSATINSATSGITVAAWIYRNANQNGWITLATRQKGTSYFEHYWLGFNGSNYRWFVNTTNGYSNYNLGGTAPLGQWVHLAGTYDGSTVKLFMNGVENFSSAHGGTLPSETNPINIGGSSNDGTGNINEDFNGKVDNVRIYNRAISASEIESVFQSEGDIGTTTVKKVMPLGDSITYGFVSPGAPNNDDGGYRRFLWERLAETGLSGEYDFVGSLATGIATIDRDHEGHNGWRIDQISGSINEWLTTHQSDRIMLMIGTNDLIQGATPDEALSRLAILLDQIHAARPSARLFVASIAGVRTNNDYSASINAEEINSFNAGILPLVNQGAAQGSNITFVDVNDLSGLDTATESADYGSDGLHLSLAGYSKMANVWYQAITSN